MISHKMGFYYCLFVLFCFLAFVVVVVCLFCFVCLLAFVVAVVVCFLFFIRIMILDKMGFLLLLFCLLACFCGCFCFCCCCCFGVLFRSDQNFGLSARFA